MGAHKHHGKQTGKAVTTKVLTPGGAAHMETFVPWKVVKPKPAKIIVPAGAPAFTVETKVKPRVSDTKDSPLLRALGLAHHWQQLLDSGRYQSLRDIAEAEGIDVGRASKILRLAQLSPTVIEAAMARGQLKAGLSEVLKGFPLRWDIQAKSAIGTIAASEC